ncbi:MAG: alpha/beta hydrolase-fold protein [Pontixanthobacter sp.]
MSGPAARWWTALVVLCCAPFLGVSANDDVSSQPLTIGTTYVVSTHDADRAMHVAVPPGYEDDERTYPLIIMLDGGLDQDFHLTFGLYRWNQLWQRSEPAIFVGLQTVDRQRKLLPLTDDPVERERYPTAGESATFRTWIGDTILPLIRARYRDDGRAFLIGESAAGHFVVETWAYTPNMFDGYAAISPSLQWNDQSLSRVVEREASPKRPPLYVSLANEGGATEEGMIRLLRYSGPNTCFADRRTELVHADTLHGLLPEALQYLLPTEADWLDDFGLSLRCDDRLQPSVAP